MHKYNDKHTMYDDILRGDVWLRYVYGGYENVRTKMQDISLKHLAVLNGFAMLEHSKYSNG